LDSPRLYYYYYYYYYYHSCPAFFRESASQSQDQVAGAICFFLAVVIIFISIVIMMKVIQKLLFGLTTKVVYTATHCNGYLGIVFGTGMTLITQSSSITTSVLIPFAGAGALTLQQIYPLVLGANLGTAIQSVIGAMDKAGTDPLQVALAHMFFNVTGILLWYPLPWLRQVPMYAAKRLGRGAAIWRLFPLVYIAVAFLIGPLFFEMLTVLFEGSTGAVIGACFLTVVVAAVLIGLIWWCYFAGGDQKYVDFVVKYTHGSATVAPATTTTPDEETVMPSSQRSPSTSPDVGGNSNNSDGDNQDEDNISVESRDQQAIGSV
jgi:sodium-dependent phosphate cotransporter